MEICFFELVLQTETKQRKPEIVCKLHTSFYGRTAVRMLRNVP